MNNLKKKMNKKGKCILTILLLLIIGLIIVCANHKGDYQERKVSSITEESSFPTEVYGVPVHTQLVEENTKARPGIKRKVKYLVIHETDNYTVKAGAKNHAEFLSKNNTSSTSWHYTVDQKEIYHHIPDNEVAHHAATETGNLYGVGIELCVNEDGDFEKTFDNAAKLVAYLLKEYHLNSNAIRTHHDFSGKDCPHSILRDNRMDEFKKKVKQYQK